MCVCVGGGGGALQLQCKSESARCSEKQQSPCEGDGGACILREKNARIQKKSTPKKKMGICSPVFCIFSFIPNPIT